jgi:hypothetical protein
MIEEFSRKARESSFDPLSAILFKALQVIAFLFFIAFVALARQKDTGKIDTKAEFFVSMTWPEASGRLLDRIVFSPEWGDLLFWKKAEGTRIGRKRTPPPPRPR